MHLLGGAKDRIYRTCLNTFGATDTFILTNERNHRWFFFSVFRVELGRFHIQQIGERIDGRLTARWTLVDFFSGGNGFSIRATARVTALTTLGLRQTLEYLLNYRVAFDPVAFAGETEQCAAGERKPSERQQRCDHGLVVDKCQHLKPALQNP